MDRTIKFRGKRLDNGEWVYGYFYTIQEIEHYILQPCALGVLHTEVIPETIGQFAGLFDKNGKEIYEGDIVEWLFFSYGCHGEQEHYLKGYVEWHQGGFIFNVTENDFEDAGFYAISDLHTDTESDVKILGNIYDNPDLIKEE